MAFLFLRQALGAPDQRKSFLTLSMDYAIGIDLGGSSVKAVAVSVNGDQLAQAVVAFDPSATMDWAQRIRTIIDELQAAQSQAAAHIGLSAPGLAARDRRSIAH